MAFLATITTEPLQGVFLRLKIVIFIPTWLASVFASSNVWKAGIAFHYLHGTLSFELKDISINCIIP